MAIRTSNLALGNLSLNHFPRKVPHHPANGETFFPSDVVEIKTARVGFATVHTRMEIQIVQQPLALGYRELPLPHPCLGDVVARVCLIVGTDLRSSTIP